MRRRGKSLIELNVSLLLLMLVGIGAMSYFSATFIGRDAVHYGNLATTQGRQPLDIMADHIRNAQPYTDGTQPVAVSAVAANSVTYYADDAGDTVRYYLDGTTIRRQDNAGTTDVMTGVTSLQFRYWLAGTTSTYNPQSVTEGDPTTMGLTERARIATIDITVTTSTEGYSRTYTSQVRLRNSPEKRRL